jgi:hypothetical protein
MGVYTNKLFNRKALIAPPTSLGGYHSVFVIGRIRCLKVLLYRIVLSKVLKYLSVRPLNYLKTTGMGWFCMCVCHLTVRIRPRW